MSSETQARYVDPVPVARAVMGALGAGVVLDLHRLVYAVAQHRTGAVAASMPSPALHVIVRAATVVLFVMWFDRVWRNRAALAGAPGQSKRATLIALFMPPFLFFRPVAILRDAWSAAGPHPEQRRLEAALQSPRRTFGGPVWVSHLIVMWWTTFLIPPALVLTGLRRGTMSMDEKYVRVVTSESLNVIAGVLAATIVYLISARQREAVTRAPWQRVMSSPRLPGSPVELLIREQARRRPPLERVVDLFRDLLWPREPRRR